MNLGRLLLFAGAVFASAPAPSGSLDRDPFRSPLDRLIDPAEECPWALGAYDPNALKLVAIIQNTEPRAMVEDAQGKGFSIGLGSRIGCPGGIVTSIEPGRVVLREELSTFYANEPKTVDVIMRLRAEE